MTKQSGQNILIPVKFISLILHLLVVTMAYFSYTDNIIAAYPALASQTDSLYIGGRVSFLACNTITLIFLLFEMGVLFAGTLLFRDRTNFINSTLHLFGAILWSSYIFQQWQFSGIWGIWAVTSLLPFFIQISTIVSVSSK